MAAHTPFECPTSEAEAHTLLAKLKVLRDERDDAEDRAKSLWDSIENPAVHEQQEREFARVDELSAILYNTHVQEQTAWRVLGYVKELPGGTEINVPIKYITKRLAVFLPEEKPG
jgi:hypothetical protein